MPVAVILEDTQKFDLRTLEGAYVVIRQMTYGEKLVRGSLSGKMKIHADKRSEFAGEIEMATEKIALWDLQNLVVSHNLQDRDGRDLNFRDIQDIRKLRADIGEEIGTYIDRLNSFEDIEEGN